MAMPALILALCAGLAALGHLDRLPLSVVRLTAGLVVFGGAGLPILVRWTPGQPSLLKLLVFSSVLSVPLVGVLAAGLQQFVSLDLLWPVTLGCLALLQLTGLRGELRIQNAGKAAIGALGISLALAGIWSALLLGAGNGIRIEADGAIWQAGVARSLLRGGGLENPWLAGSPLLHHPAPAAFVATVAGALRLAPTLAAALIDVWCLALLPTMLYLMAAALWGEWRRSLLGSFLGLVGWNALGVFAGSLGLGTPVETKLFLPGGGGAAALLFAIGAWLAAVHALRHGMRPWVGLCALCHGLAFCMHPPLGACAALATALGAGIGRRAGHTRLLLFLGLALLPGLYLASRFTLAASPQVGNALDSGSLAAVVVSSLPLLLACAALGRESLGLGGEDAGQAGDQRLLLRWLWLCAAVPLVAVAFAPAWSEIALGRCSGLVLGILAAGGLVSAWDRRGAWRSVSVALALLALGGGAWTKAHGAAELLDWAQEVAPVLEGKHHVTPAFLSADEAPGDGTLPKLVVATREEERVAQGAQRRHLAQAYHWLREEYPLRDLRPILVRRVEEAAQGPVLPDPATLYADMPLWVDRFEAVALGVSSWRARHEATQAMYKRTDGVTINRMRELVGLDRPVIFIVTEQDRLQTRGFIEKELVRWGARESLRVGSVALFSWSPEQGGRKLR